MPGKVPVQSPSNKNRWWAGPSWRYAGLGFVGEEGADEAQSNSMQPVRVKRER